MNSYQAPVTFILFICVASQLHAEGTSVGIGVGVHEDVQIFIPIKTSRLLVEPGILISKSNYRLASPSSINNSEYSYYEVGIGIYKKKNVKDGTSLYYGSKFGLFERKDKSNSTSPEYRSSESSDRSGYFIAPTIGVEQYLSDMFSVGIDVSFRYTKADHSQSYTFETLPSYMDSDNNYTEKSYITHTEIIARYYF